LTKIVEAVINAGRELSIRTLCDWFLAHWLASEPLLIEFGNDESAFDAISPAGYFVNGQSIKQRDFDEDFL
jgi:hypothetical protein